MELYLVSPPPCLSLLYIKGATKTVSCKVLRHSLKHPDVLLRNNLRDQLTYHKFGLGPGIILRSGLAIQSVSVLSLNHSSRKNKYVLCFISDIMTMNSTQSSCTCSNSQSNG